jgi:quinol monooxygenase YgiN
VDFQICVGSDIRLTSPSEFFINSKQKEITLMSQNTIVVMTMNVTGLTHKEFRAILEEMGVETRPEAGIYQHISHPTETGLRIIEIWESQKGFEEFAERRLKPAIAKLGIQRETTIVFQPLHNFFGPRINELPGLIGQLPGGPNT